MNLHVIEQHLNDHILESNRRHTNIEIKLDNKVDYRTFMIIFTILSGILGYMTWQIHDIQDKTSQTALSVATIVQGYNIQAHN